MPASTTRPQRSLNCGLRALAPSPTSSLSTDLLAHSFRALVALASTSTFVSKGPAHPPLSGRDGEWASPSLPVVPLYSLECKLYKNAVTWPSRERDTALRSDPGDTRQVRGCARPPRPARISPPSRADLKKGGRRAQSEPHLYTFGQQISYLLQSASAFPEDAVWEPSSHRLQTLKRTTITSSPLTSCTIDSHASRR